MLREMYCDGRRVESFGELTLLGLCGSDIRLGLGELQEAPSTLQLPLLLAPELELFAELREPLQTEQLLNRLLAFAGVHVLQASQLLLLDKAGVAEIVAIQIVEL